MYRCARASRWGDRLPIDDISEVNKSNEDIEEHKSNPTLLEEDINYESSEDEADDMSEKEALCSEAPFSTKPENNL